MAIATQITVEEYLRTSFDPDCEYVDGEVVERNVGKKSHSKVQINLMIYLKAHEAEWGVFSLQEWRLRLSEHHYRVPDVCIVAGPEPDDEILCTPPFVCVEVLSPEDRLNRVQIKVGNYLAHGVKYVWVLDPKTKRAFVYTDQEAHELASGFLRTENPAIEIPLAEIFE